MSKVPKGTRLCHPKSPAPQKVQRARKIVGMTQFQAAALLYRSTVWWQEIEYGNLEMDPALWEYWQLLATISRTPKMAISPEWFWKVVDITGRENLHGYEEA